MNEPRSLDLISLIYFLGNRTFFLTGEAHEGVRFLMRRNLCNPEAII
jgi:hypothetical protein